MQYVFFMYYNGYFCRNLFSHIDYRNNVRWINTYIKCGCQTQIRFISSFASAYSPVDKKKPIFLTDGLNTSIM